MTVRLGVLGAGSHSTHCHGPALVAIVQRQSHRIRLDAVCDIDHDKAEAYRQRFDFADAYTDLELMLRRQPLDGLLAITPVAMTADLVQQLLPRRIPLLIEKPPGADIRQTQRLHDCAKSMQTLHMISFDRRFNPAWLRARQWLQSHQILQPPLRMNSTMQRISRLEPEFVSNTGIHVIDIVLSVFGPPCYGTLGVKRANGDRCASFAGELIFAQNRTATIRIEPDAGQVSETHELLGPDYRLCVDMLQCSLQASYRDEPVFNWRISDDAGQVDREGTLNETLAFIEMIEQQRQCLPDLASGLLTMQVAHAIERSESFGNGRAEDTAE